MASWTSTLDDVDDETARLIVRLQLEDLSETSADSRTDSDAGFARTLFETELQNYNTIRGFPEVASTKKPKKARVTKSQEAPAKAIPEIPNRDCVACGDAKPITDINIVPCQHAYCDDCIDRLFRDCVVDETLYPPRCCRQVIDFEGYQHSMRETTRRNFIQKREELDDKNRVYCNIKTCSEYIPERHRNSGDGTARCPTCHEATCLICKGASHRGRDCPQDRGTQQILELARTQGWQSCTACHRMVELDTGCNHMTCICGHEFCYVCGAQWKTCECPQFDEARLFERAQVIVNREGGGNAQAAREMLDVLRENHECTHERWRNRQGAHDCDGCGDTMPVWIYQCRQCHTLLCRRCRSNRL